MVKKYVRLILFIALISVLVLYFKDAIHIFGRILRAFRPVLIALFFALVFNIPTKFFEEKVFKFKHKKLRRPIAITVTYVLIFGLVALILYFLIPQLNESVQGFIGNLPEYKTSLYNNLNDFIKKIGMDNEFGRSIIERITNSINDIGSKFSDIIPKTIELIKGFTQGMIEFMFAIILSIFMISDKDRLLKQFWKFIYAITPLKVSNWIKYTAIVSSKIFSKFLGGQIIEAFILAVSNFIGMLILRLPYPLLVSVIAFAANIIPMLGAYIGGFAGFFIIALVSFKQAIIYGIFIILLQQIENNLTYPKVVGNSLGLSGFWILSSAIIGGALFGFWGIMIGVPAVAVLYKMLGRVLNKNPEPNFLTPKILKKPTQKTRNNGSAK